MSKFSYEISERESQDGFNVDIEFKTESCGHIGDSFYITDKLCANVGTRGISRLLLERVGSFMEGAFDLEKKPTLEERVRKLEEKIGE